MPKKRKKKRVRRTKAELPPAKTQGPGGAQQPNSRKSWRRALYEKRAEGLERLIRFFPLFSGAWVAGGLLLDDILSFAALSVFILLPVAIVRLRRREDIAFRSVLEMLVYAVLVASCFLLYAFTSSAAFCALAAVAALLGFFTEWYSDAKQTTLILFRCLGRVVEMSLYSLLSVLSQAIVDEPQFHWEYAALGFVPGTCLAAAMLLRDIDLFEAAGWRRSRISEKNGAVRPAALAQWYSFALILGPAIPVILVPLGRFPAPFLLLALAFVPIPRLCQSFLERSRPDSLVFVHTMHLAFALSIGVMLVAILARLFA